MLEFMDGGISNYKNTAQSAMIDATDNFCTAKQ